MLDAYDTDYLEIGVDEAGRGPLFGRVYSAAVVICEDFDISKVKDSKKFTSQKKINEAYEYIYENAIAIGVGYSDETEIDKINIREATFKAMHRAIKNTPVIHSDYTLLIDGNAFKPYTYFENDEIKSCPYKLITKGDNKFASIAAASIIAKVERDQYIDELCKNFPKLVENYQLNKNKGYGTKAHIEGINKYGITCYHRKSFNICKQKKEIIL